MAKKANNKRPSRNIDRNHLAGPWEKLEQRAVPPDVAKTGIVAAFQNNRYTIFLKTVPSMEFGQPDESGKVVPMEIVHLMVQRNDKKAVRSWADLQRIKNEILGPMTEAIELFPAEWRVVDAPQTHMFALAPGATFPLGMIPEGIAAMAKAEAEAAGMKLKKEDIEVFVVRTTTDDGNLVEVFVDEEEAKAGYEESDHEMPEASAVETIGDVPSEDQGAIWTDKAKAKAAAVIRRIEEIDAANKAKSDQMPDDGDDAIVINDDPGPGMVEDEMAENGDFHPGKPGEEEMLNMEQLMRDGIANRENTRKDALKRANEVVTEQEEATKEEAAKEEKAKDDLADMRKDLLKN